MEEGSRVQNKVIALQKNNSSNTGSGLEDRSMENESRNQKESGRGQEINYSSGKMQFVKYLVYPFETFVE